MTTQDRDNRKRYLGDGVYVTFDGYALVLTTENGISETNRIVLETEVYEAFVAYVEQLKQEIAALTKAT